MKNFRFYAYGILFAMLWSSASPAGKWGLYSTEPLVLFQIRFFFAGILLLLYSIFFIKDRFPKNLEWKKLAIFGTLNVTLYLGFFIIGLQHITAGIGSLASATNPLFISIFSAFWLERSIKKKEWMAIFLGILGVFVSSYPLLQTSQVKPLGLIFMTLSMISYSLGTVYFSKQNWTLNRVTINAWQVILGGLFLLPFTLFFHEKATQWNLNLWLSLLWLVVPVSIIAVQLWLVMLKMDPVKSAFFLYLCPIFGFIYSKILFQEPITVYTLSGTLIVFIALYLGKK